MNTNSEINCWFLGFYFRCRFVGDFVIVSIYLYFVFGYASDRCKAAVILLCCCSPGYASHILTKLVILTTENRRS